MILKFNSQFDFDPEVENVANLSKHRKYIVCGMGGSHLAADLIKAWQPKYQVMVHSDYGLPNLSEEELRDSLIIASSYSGNTEETIDAFRVAEKKGLDLAVITVGGALYDMAVKAGVPIVRMPDTGIQPRMALGFSLKGILKLMGEEDALDNISSLAKMLKPEIFESEGRALAETLRGKIPVIYSSRRNYAVSYNWKIKLNETGKIPAFYNILPELNHNEMTGMDVKDSTRSLSDKFIFIFLRDADDDERTKKRMEVLADIYASRDLEVKVIDLASGERFYKIFNSLTLADWTALNIAEIYGLESEQVPLVEEFKKRIG